MSSGTVSKHTSYPFSAVLGMDDAKRAILCALTNKRIRSVLIRGPSGVAKTTLARSINGITERRVINVPLNVTEEQLFGGMDIESTLADGVIRVNKGLLHSADGNILYIDDVNLMDQSMLISLMESIYNKKVILEREGVSSSYETDTLVIASMNPEDSDLSSHILDRFDLCAYAMSVEEDNEKGEILRRNVEFIEDPEKFSSKYRDEEAEIESSLERAKAILPMVTISDELVNVIVELCTKVGAQGHRGDIAMINTSIALAALNGRDEVMRKDIEEAAALCLIHRRDYTQPPEPPEQEEQEQDQEDETEDEQEEQEQPPEPPEQEEQEQDQEEQEQPPEDPDFQNMLDEMLFEIGEQFRVIDYLSEGTAKKMVKTKSRMGRRAVVESSDRTGRYSRSRTPSERTSDIAFDATIRAAAPHQKTRDKGDLAISIRSSDIKEKIRERRSGCTILFLVDASGSLGVRRRMATVKGAILSMLRESYVKRDRVAMMAFRRDSSELILPPTKSVEYTYKKLEELPTGGKTPLGEALLKVNSYMSIYSRSHPGEMCYIVMVTDGRANVPVTPGADANAEVLEMAKDMKIPGVRWIIIDAGTGFARFDHAMKLARELEGTYFKLDELNADKLASSVKAVIR